MLARFGKRRLINDPNLRLAQQVDHLQRQTPLDFGDLPRALPHELAQRLHVRAGHALRHRLNRLALPVQQQPFQINPRPMTPLAAPHRLDQVFQEPSQATIQGFQCVRLHAPTVPDSTVQRNGT